MLAIEHFDRGVERFLDRVHVEGDGDGGGDREWSSFSDHLCRRAALAAYEIAGVGPKDMSVAEVHDASAIAENGGGFAGVEEAAAVITILGK